MSNRTLPLAAARLARRSLLAPALALTLIACGGGRPDTLAADRSYMQVDPAAVQFEMTVGADRDPADRVVNVGNASEVPLAAPTATVRYDDPTSGWLSVAISSAGVGTAGLAYQVDLRPVGVTGFRPGTYRATLSLDAPGAANTPVAIRVTLVVDAAPAPGWRKSPWPAQMGMGFTATPLDDGTVVVMGGAFTPRHIGRLDPSTGFWSDAGVLTRARSWHTATLLRDGRVLVAGGDGTPSTWELYDPATVQVTATGAMLHGYTRPTATLLGDGRVLVVGASTSSATATSTAEIFDPDARAWTDATPPAPALPHSAVAVTLGDGRALVTGHDGKASECVLFDPAAGSWSVTGGMGHTWGGYALIALADGGAFAIGGHELYSDWAVPESARYDPALGTWRTSGTLRQPRPSMPGAAAQLTDGRVLIAGGWLTDENTLTPDSWTADSEIYDPGTEVWSFAGNLAIARGRHALIALPRGRAVAVGGQTYGSYQLVDEYWP